MKSRGVAAILALFLGGLGIHRFYLGKPDGLIYLLFCWTLIPAVIALIECIIFLCMSDEVFDDQYNSYHKSLYLQNHSGRHNTNEKPDKTPIKYPWYARNISGGVTILLILALIFIIGIIGLSEYIR